MNTLANIQELARALRNMIRTGLVVETNLKAGRCRVQTGGMCTDWLQWLTCRAGRSRTWWAPSVGEQVLILAVGGELDTAFVLPGIYSGDNPPPSASADALHIRFPDGAVIEYEPETSALTVSGIKTASVTASDSVTATVPVVMVKASTRVTLDTPEVVCTNRLITGTLEVQKGGTMRGNIEHTGGELSSNGKVLHTHKHPGDSGGTTGGTSMTARYLGMNRSDGLTVTDLEHISQSIGDILRTPVGSRVMRRDYGSLLASMIDQPQTPALELQIKVACYMAVLKWEPRVTLSSVTTERSFDGRMTVTLTGQHNDTGQPLSLTIPVS